MTVSLAAETNNTGDSVTLSGISTLLQSQTPDSPTKLGATSLDPARALDLPSAQVHSALVSSSAR
jgi:hypothetical protein